MSAFEVESRGSNKKIVRVRKYPNHFRIVTCNLFREDKYIAIPKESLPELISALMKLRGIYELGKDPSYLPKVEEKNDAELLQIASV